MRILQDDFDYPAFLRGIGEVQHRLLMLDYDGTLAPFRPNRHEAIPYPGVRDRLRDLVTAGRTRLVIISGRSVADLVQLLVIEPLPELWGSHGWEHRQIDGQYWPPALTAVHQNGLAAARAGIEAAGLTTACEAKPTSLALHWRGHEETLQQAIMDHARTVLQPLTDQYGLTLKPFDGGMELSVPGKTKGDAVRAMLTEQPEPYVAAYLGDDLTDEDAFAALAGKGVSILVRPELRDTRAMVWLQPPDELLAFLAHW